MASKKRADRIAGLLFLLPNFLGFILFILLPVIISLYLSLTKYDLFGPMIDFGQEYVVDRELYQESGKVEDGKLVIGRIDIPVDGSSGEKETVVRADDIREILVAGEPGQFDVRAGKLYLAIDEGNLPDELVIRTKGVFVGLGNYYKLLFELDRDAFDRLSGFEKVYFWKYVGDSKFWQFLWNTVVFLFLVPANIVVSLALALAMNQQIRGIVVYRTIYFLPVISSIVAAAILWRWIYNPEYGLLNNFLLSLGIPKASLPQWLNSTLWAKPAIILMLIWKGAGYNMLLYLAALQNIPKHLYEAAEVDGATFWARFRYVTLPHLKPVTFFITIMGVIGGLQMFGEIFVMTGGGPGGSTTTIVYYIWQNAFNYLEMGYAAATSWVLFLLIFAVTVVQWKFQGKEA